VTRLLVDTSVTIKWFHAEGESELLEARALLAGHRDEILTAPVLDLGVYELGNVLLRRLRWGAARAASQIEDLLVICGPVLAPVPAWYPDAAALAETHGLTFYDAMSRRRRGPRTARR